MIFQPSRMCAREALGFGGFRMKGKRFATTGALRLTMIAAALGISACDAVNDAIDEVDNIGNDDEVHYYLSLGDSLAVGAQPNGAGAVLPTNDGYADQLHSSIRPAFEAGGGRDLQLTKFGCPGETLDDMINGGSCVYIAGSQLDAAVDFLQDNGDKVHLVTIDIGGNDFRNQDCVDTAVDLTCANNAATQVAIDLATVLTALQDAADPATTIVGVNYYNPFLSSWLDEAAGQKLAMESAGAVAILNDFLGTTYGTAGVPVADVATAFASEDFTTMVATSLPAPNDMLPLSVSNICDYTYMCDPDRGPDLHPTDIGYEVMADAIEAALTQ
jgi:lysophospholipase L1-like esterase